MSKNGDDDDDDDDNDDDDDDNDKWCHNLGSIATSNKW